MELSNLDELEEEFDGSVLIDLNQGIVPHRFEDNLSEYVSEKELNEIASDLLDSIERDKETRSRRDEQYEEGLRRTGLGNDAPGGATFKGASKVVHPVMAEACIDFSARAIKELFPAGGPVRIESDLILPPEQESQVKKLAECLNNEFTVGIPEYRPTYEILLTQLPLGGSQYTKFFPDMENNKIGAEFVPIDDVFIPYNCADFYSSHRTTHRQYITQDQYDARVERGEYRDIRAIKAATEPDKSASAIASEKIEGKSATGMNEDGTRTVYEVYTHGSYDFDDLTEGRRSPYIIVIDEIEQSILSIRRNWDEQDEFRKKIDWIVDDTFIPWRGAQGIGLPHLIGGLAGAATGTLRALLDSAHINNAPTLLKLKGSKINGTTQSVAITQIADIEGPVGIDDIRKYLMPMPFNPPSNVLFQLLGWLTDAAKGVVSTASEKIADATSNTPVGTVQALIEQGAVIFSSIHSRLHFSQAKKFEIVLRILKQYFPEKLQAYQIDPQIASLKGIRPVSDPRVFSEAQRYAQMQGVMQLAASSPDQYNQIELHKSMLSLMKVDQVDIARFLKIPPQPQAMDPANELISFLTDKPVLVELNQDHLSHIIVHLNFLRDPLCGRNPIMVPITAKILHHLRAHIGYFFAQRLQSAAQGVAQANPMGQQGQPPMQSTPQQAVEPVMATLSDKIVNQDTGLAQEALQLIVEIEDFVRTQMMSENPDMAMLKVQQDSQDAMLRMQADKNESDLKIKMLQEQNRDTRTEFEQYIKIRAQEHKEQMGRMELAQNGFAEQLKQTVEIQNNRMDNYQKQMTELLKNHDDNRTKLLVEQIKASMVQMDRVHQPIDDKSYMSELGDLVQDRTGEISSQLNEVNSKIDTTTSM